MADRIALLLLIALTVAQTPAFTQPTSVNLISNSGFEQPFTPDSWRGIWEIREDLVSRGRIFVSPKYRQSGLNSLGLYSNGRNIVDSIFFDYGLIQRLPADLVRGRSLRYGGYMNAEGDGVAMLRIVAVGEDGSVFVRSIRLDPQPNYGRRRLHLREDIFDVPDIPIKEAFLFCAIQRQDGSAYFDDLFVTIASPTTRVIQPANSQDAIAHVYIDNSVVVRRIPETLYGMNIEYAHGFFGVWNEYTREFNQQVLDLTSRITPTSLRFPGGLFANFYHWRNGVGPVRPTALLLPERGDTINTFGTDEAIAFARRVDAPLFVTANAYTGTPEEAVEWLRYFKSKDFPVTHWEIGNEIYFVNDPSDPQGEFWSPERYAATFNRFAEALRSEDPDVKLAADIEFNFGMNGCGQVGPTGCWADVVLRDSGRHIDYLALHNSLAPIMIGHDAGWDLRTVYEGMLAAPLHVKLLLDDLSRKVDEIGGPDSDRIRFAMVEYGPFFQIDPRNRFIDHVKSMASALYTASLLKVFVEHPRVEFAQGFSLFDPWTQGWIGFLNDNEHTAKAPLLALELFRKNFGDLLLPTETSSPRFSSRSIGIVPAAANIPYIDVVSSRDEQSGELRLVAINKNLDRPLSAFFVVRGFAASGNAVIKTLASTAPDANTGTRFPSTVPQGVFGEQATYSPNGRFLQGGPDEVTIRTSTAPVNGACFTLEFPPHSVSVITIPGGTSTSPDPCLDPAAPVEEP